MCSVTCAGPVTSARVIWSYWLNAGLWKAGSMMRLTLNATSAAVSGVPSENRMPGRRSNTSVSGSA